MKDLNMPLVYLGCGIVGLGVLVMFMPALIPGQVGMGAVTLPASIFLMVLGGGFVFAARFDRFKTPIVEATSEHEPEPAAPIPEHPPEVKP